MADQYAKDAATGRAPRERFPEGYAEETSLTHMTRVATEARSRATTVWIAEHVRPGRRCFGVSANHEGGMRWPKESAPRGKGGGGERRGGGPRPALECTLSFFFPFQADVKLFFSFPFVGMRGPL